MITWKRVEGVGGALARKRKKKNACRVLVCKAEEKKITLKIWK
jgi:hypothetical protein